jgi:hypothetical protein
MSPISSNIEIRSFLTANSAPRSILRHNVKTQLRDKSWPNSCEFSMPQFRNIENTISKGKVVLKGDALEIDHVDYHG